MKSTEAAWDEIADYILTENLREDGCIHYGPWSPPERELGLLGPLHGKRVLELGCGAGQCSVAFARAGAQVTALDLSTVQLAAARQLATARNVQIEFVHGSAENLSRFADDHFDLIFANYVLPYVQDLPRAFAEYARVLSAGGRIVFSLDHPLRNCFFDEEDAEIVIYAARSYFDTQPIHWEYSGTNIPMQSAHRTIAGWIDLIHDGGLQLVRLVEPRPPVDLLDEIWPEDSPHASLRNLPQTAIFVARKPTCG